MKPRTSVFGIVAVLQTIGCSGNDPGPPVLWPLVHRSQDLELRHCVDGTGHLRGTLPFAFDGDCCCTPHAGLLAAWHAAGLPEEVTLEQVNRRYQQLEIVTGLQHRECNNQCTAGPHVVLGGSCMAPPTPATRNYEIVISGRFDESTSDRTGGAE